MFKIKNLLVIITALFINNNNCMQLLTRKMSPRLVKLSRNHSLKQIIDSADKIQKDIEKLNEIIKLTNFLKENPGLEKYIKKDLLALNKKTTSPIAKILFKK